MISTKMKKAWSDFLQSFKDVGEYFTSQKIESYTILITLIFVLSFLDAIFTVVWLDSGLATEANPLLKQIVDSGNFAFVASKVFMTLIGCYILYKVKDKSKTARFAIVSLFLMYTLLILYHIFGALASIDSSYIPDWVSDVLIFLS